MKLHSKKISIIAFLACFILGASFLIDGNSEAQAFHSPAEIAYFQMLGSGGEHPDSLLAVGYSTLFAGSGECLQCHGYDSTGFASTDFLGNDVNLVDDWRSTMMANSAKDPYWRAKVSHEVILYPEHQEALETKCTSCHAPMGHFEAFHQGQSSYSIAEMQEDELAMDGVSCLACHKITEEGLGLTFSGDINYDTAKVAYGPYISPLESPMLMETDYTPVYSEHIRESGVCASCHTLLTKTLDFEGNETGNSFVEQATYHEWLNSEYSTKANPKTCQSCHMEALTKGSIQLVIDSDTEARSPFYLHELVGANTLMLTLLKNNIEALNLAATEEQFDETISATEDMLRNKSVVLTLEEIERSYDTLAVSVNLRNRAGHKFPSGYPARRVFLELVALDPISGDTLFISGKTDQEHEIIGHDETYEPHYDIIRSEDEVQIYELVMGDVNLNPTTILARGSVALKDNRLVPKGFSTSHAAYDTTLIVGAALTDPNFNFDESGEGSGIDIVQYNIPLDGWFGEIDVQASLFYQAAPPRDLNEIFTASSPSINQFKSMIEEIDQSPFLVKSKTIQIAGSGSTSIENENSNESTSFISFQNPLQQNESLQINTSQNYKLFLYNSAGQLVLSRAIKAGNTSLMLNLSAGNYFLQFETTEKQFLSKKLIILP